MLNSFFNNVATMVPLEIIHFLAAVAMTASFYGLYRAMIQPDNSRARLKSIIARRDALRAGLKAPKKRKSLLDEHQDTMDKVVARLKLMKSKHAEEISAKLAQAGWRSQQAIVRYLFFKAVMPLAFGALALLYLYGLGVYDFSATTNMMICLIAVFGGYYGPGLYVKNAADKRRQKILKALPDTLDLMVICAEAGLSPDAMMERVAKEIKPSFPEMGDEVSLTSVEMGFLPDRKHAFENLKERCNIKQLDALVNTLVQTEKYGTPLAQSLRVLSSEFRNERVMKAEEKGARLPALLTVPMIIFILPPLFIVLIGPGILSLIDMFKSL